MILVVNQSPLSTIFAIVWFPGSTKLVLSGDPLYHDLKPKKGLPALPRILKIDCKNWASQQTFGTLYIVMALLQLNEYETAPYFLQVSKNMTSNCFFTFVFSPFLPEFTCFVPKIVLNIKIKQFLAQNRLIQVRTGKNTKENKQSLVMFWLNWWKYGSV